MASMSVRFAQLTGRIAWGTLLTCWALTTAGVAPDASAQAPRGRLAASDIELPAIPWLVRPSVWEGHPVVMAFTRNEAVVPGAPGGPRLFLLGLQAEGWVKLQEWPLPVLSRWVEPLMLPGGESGWLLLNGPELQVGRIRNGILTWQSLCTCDSSYAHRDPEELGTRLARDIDGDGVDEVLLPTARGLTVYRTVTQTGSPQAAVALDPIALLRWDPAGMSGVVTNDANAPEAPELESWNVAGTQWLVRMKADGFVGLRLPPTSAHPAVVLSSETRTRAESAGLSPPAEEALARLPNGEFKDGAAFWDAALQAGAPERIASEIPDLLIALRGGWSEAAPTVVSLAGTNAKPGDRGYLLAWEDLTGDGMPDLLFGMVRNETQILKTESELSFYRGASTDGTAFGMPQRLAFQGPAAGAVLRTGGSEHALAVAHTEVTLSAVFRAMSSHELTVQSADYLLDSSGLGGSPTRHADLTFKGFEEGAQPIVVAADLEGRGQDALLMNLRPDAISAFLPAPGGPDFTQPAGTLSGPLPRKREEVLVGNLDGTGRASLLFWYRGKKMSVAQRRTLRVVRWESAK